MDDSIPSVFGLRYHGRALCSQLADKERARFLIGTQNLREENEVDLVEYHESNNSVTCERIYTHSAEIWDISSCPSRADLVFTVYNTVESGYGATLWRMDELDTTDEESENSAQLQSVFELPGHEGVIRSVLWHPGGELDHVVSLDEHCLRKWDLAIGAGAGASSAATATSAGVQSDVRKLIAGAWDPFHTQYLATTHDTSIKTWDLRAISANGKAQDEEKEKPVVVIKRAHADCVRALDYNPNRPHVLATAGACDIKFWDLRAPEKPLKTISAGHSHWVWCVKYNPSFDQLVLSSSSDASVCLWAVPSISSTPVDVLKEEAGAAGGDQKPAKDRLIKKYDDHEESVYAVAWNPADAWSFASLSYDGHLAVCKIPQAEKYSMIL